MDGSVFEMFRLSEIGGWLTDHRWLLCQIVFAVYMIILAGMDIRYRKFGMVFLLSGFLISAAAFFCGREISPVLLAAGAGVGITFIAASKATREAFGYGDSILIVVMGSFLGFWQILSVLLAAFAMASLFAAVMLAGRKFGRKTAFPFVPFLTAAYIGGMILGAY